VVRWCLRKFLEYFDILTKSANFHETWLTFAFSFYRICCRMYLSTVVVCCIWLQGVGCRVPNWRTDKKENTIFLIYKEIQMESVAKSKMMKGSQIYETNLVIYEDAVSHVWLCNRSRLNFLIHEENFIYFLSVRMPLSVGVCSWFLLVGCRLPGVACWVSVLVFAHFFHCRCPALHEEYY
jgi:hypothetical protein